MLIIHGERDHSCYMGRDAYAHMMEGNLKPENKIQSFFQNYLK